MKYALKSCSESSDTASIRAMRPMPNPPVVGSIRTLFLKKLGFFGPLSITVKNDYFVGTESFSQ